MANRSLPRRGIYCITSSDNRHYVGASTDTHRRMGWHRCRLSRGVHKNGRLQAAWDALGSDGWAYSVLEYVDGDMTPREQFWMDILGSAANGFNIAPVAGSNRGVVRVPRCTANLSAALIGLQAGEKNPSARLTEAEVREIRALLFAGRTQASVSKQFSVTNQTISKIHLRRKWASVV